MTMVAPKITQGQRIVNALWAAQRYGSVDTYALFHTVDHRSIDGWVCIVQLSDVVGYKATSRMTEARREATGKGYAIESRPCQDPRHNHQRPVYQHRLVT